ncbi:MAG: carboxypeptidase-like regulatory domain-containing protein, partial [Acidobacteriota bacterium]|nr:carboxypeptidase-like regulatory domain-containing protein [Acidobacteriota bacterium]
AQQTTDPNGNVFMGGPKYKKDKTPTSRFLKGTVTDDAGKPLAGALVTLTNETTKDQLTFITKQGGRYNFSDLSFTTDYEVIARFKDMQSEPRKLSQYDHTANIVRILAVGPMDATKDHAEADAKKSN